LASNLGADVPFFLYNCAARCGGIGEKVEPLLELPAVFLVLVIGKRRLKTKKMFARLDSLTAKPPSDSKHIPTGWDDEYFANIVNDLEVPAKIFAPEIDGHLEALIRTKPVIYGMSGKGPTVYGIYQTELAAKRAAKALKLAAKGNKFSAEKILVVKTLEAHSVGA
jgi:4-diphosphocytidyl-2-C-methyl-D-erythritol kinase